MERKQFYSKKRIYVLVPVLLQAIIYLVSLLVFKIFTRIKFVGQDNISNLGGRVIFAPNHSSEWDGPLVRVGLSFFWRFSPMYYVSRPKEFYTDSGWRKAIYGGYFFNLLGAYPAYSGKHDYAYSLQNHLEILKRNKALCIFPEGKRTKDGTLSAAHGGAAFLAHATKAPVVPVAISGLVRLSLKDILLFRRRVIIEYGKPILPEVLVPQQHPGVDDYKAGAKYIMDRVIELLG